MKSLPKSVSGLGAVFSLTTYDRGTPLTLGDRILTYGTLLDVLW